MSQSLGAVRVRRKYGRFTLLKVQTNATIKTKKNFKKADNKNESFSCKFTLIK